MFHKDKIIVWSGLIVIVVCPQFMLFLSFALYNILMILCYISFTFQLNSFKNRLLSGFSFLHLLLLLAYIILDLWINQYIKCWLISINKQLRIDSFLDWEGHHWVSISNHSLSLQTSASDTLL